LNNFNLTGTSRAPRRNGRNRFPYLNKIVSAQINASEPVISVDTKKKELIG
jgi:hypothetical protein